MSIFVLFAIAIIGGNLTPKYAAFDSMEACQAARTEVIASAIAAGITDGSFVCTEHKIAKLS